MSDIAVAPSSPVVHVDRGGEAHWFFGGLYTMKVTGEHTRGALTVFEVLAGPEGAPPLHVHRLEDEGFYVLEGVLDLTVGDRTVRLGPGGFAYGPRGVPHTWAVASPEPVRLLTIASPSGFERFVRRLGTPAAALTTPPASSPPPDLEAARPAAAEAGIEILGPPPGP